METEFTKGNWVIKESKFENTDIICQTVLMTDLKYNDLRSPVICDLYGQATEEGKANANLLSAAPDLFLACERALQVLDEENIYGQVRLLIVSAMRKALGK